MVALQDAAQQDVLQPFIDKLPILPKHKLTPTSRRHDPARILRWSQIEFSLTCTIFMRLLFDSNGYCKRRIYVVWATFCCAVPSIMVFGTPLLMTILARPFPQEAGVWTTRRLGVWRTSLETAMWGASRFNSFDFGLCVLQHAVPGLQIRLDKRASEWLQQHAATFRNILHVSCVPLRSYHSPPRIPQIHLDHFRSSRFTSPSTRF